MPASAQCAHSLERCLRGCTTWGVRVHLLVLLRCLLVHSPGTLTRKTSQCTLCGTRARWLSCTLSPLGALAVHEPARVAEGALALVPHR